MFALATWTVLIMTLLAAARLRAGFKREISPADFRVGESQRVPAHVSIPNRNYMNLLEIPILFYVVCLLLYATGQQGTMLTGLAWSYVILRVLHSLVHLTCNNVMHRLTVFALGNFVLIAMWVLAGLGLGGTAA